MTLFTFENAYSQFGSFGTTSISNYGTFPLFANYTNQYYPYSGIGYFGGYSPLAGNLGYFQGYGGNPYTSNIMKIMMYYQYLSYAYQFYQIARVTPMFYQQDMIADYIGSSLYSYANQNNLSAQEAILSFIQQNLL